MDNAWRSPTSLAEDKAMSRNERGSLDPTTPEAQRGQHTKTNDKSHVDVIGLETSLR